MTETARPSCRPEPPTAGTVTDGRRDLGHSGVESRLQRLVATHLDVDRERIQPDARLGEDLCVDSLEAVELTMVIEDEFDISLPEEVVCDVRTYGDILTLVIERVAG